MGTRTKNFEWTRMQLAHIGVHECTWAYTLRGHYWNIAITLLQNCFVINGKAYKSSFDIRRLFYRVSDKNGFSKALTLAVPLIQKSPDVTRGHSPRLHYRKSPRLRLAILKKVVKESIPPSLPYMPENARFKNRTNFLICEILDSLILDSDDLGCCRNCLKI